MRLDKWLWAARFFKTRSLAATAIEGGKVQVNGERAKRSRELRVSDELRIRHGPFEHHVIVRALSARRGPASEAAALYEETAASRQGRARVAEQLRLMSSSAQHEGGRPTKKDRRTLARFDPRGKL